MQKMNNKKGVKLLAAIAVFAMVFAGASVIMSDESDAATTYVSGGFTKDMQFPDGSTVVVNGDLTIDKGLTITVESGATMTINKDVKVLVDGCATGKSDEAKFIVEKGARLIINGELVVGEKGIANICVSVITQVPPATPLSDNEFIEGAFVYGTVKAIRGGELNINAEIMNGGSVSSTSTGTMVSKISGDLKLMAGASLVVKSNITVDGLTVTSAGIDASKANVSNYAQYVSSVRISESTFGNASQASSYSFSVESETVSAYTEGAKGVEKCTLIITDLIVDADVKAGTFTIGPSEKVESKYCSDRDLKNAVDLGSSVIIAENGKIAVAENKDPSEDASLVFDEDSNVVIDGTVSIKGEVALGGEILVNGSMTISDNSKIQGDSAKIVIDGGSIEIAKATDIPAAIANLYGAYYAVSGEINKVIICDLDKALAAADGVNINMVTVSGLTGSASPDKDGKYVGAYEISQSFTIPTDVTLKVVNGLVVGKEYTITLSSDGFMNFGKNDRVVVNGKVIDNGMSLKTVGNEGNIICEVVLVNNEEAVQTFTSLGLALAGATTGDFIELAGETNISTNTTIPAGVTISIGQNVFNVKNDVVLTVDGVIIDENGKIVTAQKNDTDKKAAGKIVVNNYMVLKDGSFGYDETEFNVAGIYGQMMIDDAKEYVVMSGPVFISKVKDVENAQVEGTVEFTDDLTLSVEESGIALTVVKGAVLNIKGTMTLVNYSVVVAKDGTITGKVAAAGNVVEFNKVKGTLIVTDVIDEAQETDDLVISGAPEKTEEKSTNVSKITIVKGTLTVGTFNATEMKSFGVDEGTALVVDGALKTSDLIVSGKLVISKNGSVEADGKTITIYGTVEIDKDSVDGITADTVYIGLGKDDVTITTGANATVVGTQITAGIMYILAGSVIEEDLVSTIENVTEFYVDDALWMTAYSENPVVGGITVDKAPIVDGRFDGWCDKDENNIGKTVPVNGKSKLYADVDYEIYSVNIVADNGIGTVALDGIVLAKISNTFFTYGLKAGTHTITFELKNGYEGTVKMAVDGKAVSGYSFTLSGTDTDVSITLSGTTPAEPTAPVTPSDDGMGITDYLLIVLVVMVVILAVVVIARMFRS